VGVARTGGRGGGGNQVEKEYIRMIDCRGSKISQRLPGKLNVAGIFHTRRLKR
jgi:hypothetical protein